MPRHARSRYEGLPASEVVPLIREVVRLERELGRPICGAVVWGKPCVGRVDHEGLLHSGDLERGGAGVVDSES